MSVPETMTCAEVKDRLPLVPGADLLPSEDQVVRAHLADCTGCRRALGAFVRIRGELRGLAPQDAGGVHGQFFARLRADTLLAVQRDGDRRRRLQDGPVFRLSFPGVMTAAALFLIGVYLVSWWLPESSGVRELPATQLPADPAIEAGRFRNIGYGLSGHRPRLSIREVRLLTIETESPSEPGPKMDRPGRDGDRDAGDPRKDR